MPAAPRPPGHHRSGPVSAWGSAWARADSALLETLVHEAPVAFAFYDVDLRYRRINRLLADINGLPIEAHVGRRPSEVLEPALGAAIEARLRQVLDTEAEVFDSDFRSTVRETGETRHWQSQWFPARAVDGSIFGVAVLVVDVTERRRSEEALRRSQQRTERLQQATAELATALTVDGVARVIGEIGGSAIGATWSGMALLDDETRRFRLIGDAMTSVRGSMLDVPEIPLELPTPTSETIRTGRACYVASRAELAAWLPHRHIESWLRLTAERSWAVLPLTISGAVIGALRFSFACERVLEPEERVFLEALAGQCALAVERARLYERQQRMAATLQSSLIPDRLPPVAGLTLAARYLPGGDDAEVGGDWYDVFTLPSGRVALAVGDVMGKGVVAAAGMGRIRSALRALALADESPACVLTGLDRLMSATESDEQIVTLVYVVVDPVAGWAVGADAGHPPLVRVPPGGPPELVDFGFGSTPLGVPEQRHEVRAPLIPGELFLGYSDGLVETRDRDIGAGMDLLLTQVAGHRHQPPQRLVDDVVAGMLAGQHRHDDVTVLAMRFDG